MIQNYFFLNRFVVEANSLLQSAKIVDIFSQEKNKLIIACSKNQQEYFLEICVTPRQSFINLREKYGKAKKNIAVFFNDSIGEKINLLEIADDDRIIKINLSQSIIFFAIRGKFTNVFCLTQDDNFISFKSFEKNNLLQIRNEFEKKNYISHFNLLSELPDKETDISRLKKQFPIVGSEITKELKLRIPSDDDIIQTFKEIIEEVRTDKPTLFIDEENFNINLGFPGFKVFFSTKTDSFESVIEAQNNLFRLKYSLERKGDNLKIIEKHLEKELQKVSNKINNLKSRIDKGSKDEEYRSMGNLILANLNKIKLSADKIVLSDYTSGNEITIRLDKKLTPQKNAELYFNKSKSEKISFEKSKELLKRATSDFSRLKEIEEKISKIGSSDELNEIMKELKLKKQNQQKQKEELKEKFKQYIIDDKYKVFVGKDSKNNDLLTTKFAKQNDYWFHARSVSGSHVVLRVENIKEVIPKNILKKTAAIAAYHSKAKTAGTVPVAYTFKKYVVKKKGDPFGTVRLLKEDVLLVKPEIPRGCEYISNE